MSSSACSESTPAASARSLAKRRSETGPGAAAFVAQNRVWLLPEPAPSRWRRGMAVPRHATESAYDIGMASVVHGGSMLRGQCVGSAGAISTAKLQPTVVTALFGKRDKRSLAHRLCIQKGIVSLSKRIVPSHSLTHGVMPVHANYVLSSAYP